MSGMSKRGDPAMRPGDAGRARRKGGGFTLIEVMITVAIVAILAAIAYPSYQSQIRKSRRAQAKADIVELTQLAERYRTVNGTYVGFDPAGMTPPFNQSPRSGTAYYALDTEVTSATAYTITATPQTAGGQNNDACGTIGIDQANVKTNSQGTYSSCW